VKNSTVQKINTEVTQLDSEQNTSSVPLSEKSEESNEMSLEQQRFDPDTSTSNIFPFNRVTELRKSGETGKRSRRKYDASTPVRRSSRYSNENVKPKINDVDSNSNSSEQDLTVHERDSSVRQGSKSPSWAMRDERNLNNNVRRNRAAQKEQSTRKVLANAEPETNVENPIKSNFTTIAESAASKNNALVGKKRTQHTEWQIRNCKVRLIDCKYTFLKQNVDPEVLSKLGIVAINPYVSSDISYTQCAAWNQDIAINSAAISKKSSFFAEISCDKNKSEIEILEAKTIEKSNDIDIAQESASDATEIDDGEQKTQYTVHKGPILDIKVII
jgi:hypothetical protein